MESKKVNKIAEVYKDYMYDFHNQHTDLNTQTKRVKDNEFGKMLDESITELNKKKP